MSCHASMACGPSISTTISSPRRVRGMWGGRPSPAGSQLLFTHPHSLSLPPGLQAALQFSSQNCPLLSRMEIQGTGGGCVAFEVREEGCLEDPLPVPGQEPGAAGSTNSPCLRLGLAGVPSPPTPFPGLPDEAFESLTQLQHIYMAHNKVSAPRPGPARVKPLGHTAEGTAGAAGAQGHKNQ